MATVASTTTSTTLLAAHDSNLARRNAVVVQNDDANRLYVLLGTGTASSTNYSFSLAQNENALLPDYQGALTGIWAADGSGNAQVTAY